MKHKNINTRTIVLSLIGLFFMVIMIEATSPMTRVYSQPLDLRISDSDNLYTAEERERIDEAFDNKIDAIRGDELEPDLRRNRPYGVSYAVILPGVIIGIFISNILICSVITIAGLSILMILGVILPIEVVLYIFAITVGFYIQVKIKQKKHLGLL